MISLDERLRCAQTARGNELWNLVRDPHPEVILYVTLNRHLTEEMAVFIAKRRNASAEALGFLAGDARFRDSYKLKLLLCKNPKTPQRASFSLLKFLRIFDLGDLTRDQAIPITVRQKIELLLAEKIPALPSGVKSALARRSNSTIVLSLMERGDRHVIATCLDSSVVTEAQLCALIHRSTARPVIIRLISEHPKWSVRYAIRYALIRNFHTPMVQVIRFIPDMKTNDLKELYSYESLPNATRPYIYSELKERGETAELPQEEIFEISEDDEQETMGPL
jgi:hypothetical protein